MLYNLKEGTAGIPDGDLDYITFGKGSRDLVIVQGLGIRDVKGMGSSMAVMYKAFAKDFRVWMFDRRAVVEEGFSNWDIAEDMACAMKALGIFRADFFGASQGGMISMAMVLNHPEMVRSLVLAVTASRPNPTIERAVGLWIDCAQRHDHVSLNLDTYSLMYSDGFLRKYQSAIPMLARMVKPRDFRRFEILAAAARDFDCYDRLGEIKCPVLVLGGMQDKITTARASEEIAEKLDCKIYMYPDYGHGVFQEAKDFNSRICNFLAET